MAGSATVWMARPSQPVRPELVEGLSTLVENLAETANRWPGMPSGKFLFLGSSKTDEPKKWRPDILARVPPKGSDEFFYWADEIQ
jgi:hypothetical protein